MNIQPLFQSNWTVLIIWGFLFEDKKEPPLIICHSQTIDIAFTHN